MKIDKATIATYKDVLILSNMYPSAQDPTYGVFVRNIHMALSEHGVNVRKIAIEGKPKSLLKKVMAYINFTRKAFATLMRTNETVYVHYVAHTALPVILASYLRSLDIVAHIHGGDVYSDKGTSSVLKRMKSWLANQLLKRARRIVVPSGYFSQLVVDEFGLNQNKMFVSPSGGVDISVFKMPENNVRNDATTLFGYVGRLDEGKGLDTLLVAASQMLKEHGDFTLQIVGDGALKQDLLQLSSDLGLTDHVDFVGKIPQHALPTYYQRFDFLVFPTERKGESLGLVGLEAMACGTPRNLFRHAWTARIYARWRKWIYLCRSWSEGTSG